MKKLKTHRIEGFIRLTSGTRIGGASESVGIGAVDLTYVRNPVDGKPYLPGSSIKGRLRTVLEERVGRFRWDEGYTWQIKGSPCGCGAETCFVCRLFGPHFNMRHELGPSRLTVHDSMFINGPDASDPQQLEAELKMESANHRDSGAAHSPRLQERVPPGTVFRFTLMVDVWGGSPSEEEPGSVSYCNNGIGWSSHLAFLLDGLALLPQAGIGSRVKVGSGQFEFLAAPDGTPGIMVDGNYAPLPKLAEAEARLGTVEKPTSATTA